MTERRNPSADGTWVDEDGVVWRRRGKRGDRLDERRVRTLLRRDDVRLVVWESFVTTGHDEPDAKARAADEVRAAAVSDDDVVAHEWRSDDGAVLLMLEHHC